MPAEWRNKRRILTATKKGDFLSTAFFLNSKFSSLFIPIIILLAVVLSEKGLIEFIISLVDGILSEVLKILAQVNKNAIYGCFYAIKLNDYIYLEIP